VGGKIRTRLKKFRKKFPIFLGKFLKQNQPPAKFSYSFFLKVAQKFGRIENVPVCLWLELCTIICWCASLRGVQGRNDRGQGAQFPRRRTMKAPNDCGAPKSPNNVTRTSVQYICFRKTSGSNIGAPNLLLAPGAISFRCAPNSNSILLWVVHVQYMKWGIAQLHSYVGHNSLS